jgi:hypothetical protein
MASRLSVPKRPLQAPGAKSMHHDPAHRTQAAQVDPVRLHFIAADFLRLAVTQTELRQLVEDGLIRSNAVGAAVNACDLTDDFDVTPLGAALLAWAPLGGGSAANGVVSLGGTQCRILTCQPERAHAVSPAAVLRVCVVPPPVQERGPVPSKQGEAAALTSHANFTSLLARDMPWASRRLYFVSPTPASRPYAAPQPLRVIYCGSSPSPAKRAAASGARWRESAHASQRQTGPRALRRSTLLLGALVSSQVSRRVVLSPPSAKPSLAHLSRHRGALT